MELLKSLTIPNSFYSHNYIGWFKRNAMQKIHVADFCSFGLQAFLKFTTINSSEATVSNHPVVIPNQAATSIYSKEANICNQYLKRPWVIEIKAPAVIRNDIHWEIDEIIYQYFPIICEKIPSLLGEHSPYSSHSGSQSGSMSGAKTSPYNMK